MRLSRILLLCQLALLPGGVAVAQYAWVHLADKQGSTLVPADYFSPQAQLRRQLLGLPSHAYTDLPVRADYLQQVSERVDTVYYASRWLNALAVRATEAQLAALEQLPGVRLVDRYQLVAEAQPAALGARMSSQVGAMGDDNEKAEAYRAYQMQRLGMDSLRAHGLTGKGVTVAVFDAGFPEVNKAPAFSHMRILKTWDFVESTENVYDHNDHGTMVLSCIGGMAASKPIGLATEASFLLARTEKAVGEPFEEEVWWMQAAEWADKEGADIISSSLGYNRPRYHPSQMDGRSSYVSRAANVAASKGILVINAAGNEGSNSWKYLITPADADSVMAVGGTDPTTDYAIGFTSYGPTADGRLKPNVCAPGHTAVYNGEELTLAYGTSFAAPLVAGFAACARQYLPGLTAMELKARIERTGHLAPYYDYAHGYGIPQARKLLHENAQPDTTVRIRVNEYTEGKRKGEKYQEAYALLDRVLLPGTDQPGMIFYHVADQAGVLKAFFVAQVTGKGVIKLSINTYDANYRLDPQTDVIRFHYEGFTQALPIGRHD
ncbi:MAG: S8 family serine peptidase [Sphingobacteriia bacterium]